MLTATLSGFPGAITPTTWLPCLRGQCIHTSFVFEKDCSENVLTMNLHSSCIIG